MLNLMPNRYVRLFTMKKKYRWTEILYAPNVLEHQSITIGIIVWDPLNGALVEVSKRTDWSAVLRLDPDADTEFLGAGVDELEQQFRQWDEAGRERMMAQLSMNIIFSDRLEIETDDPGEALKQLARARGLSRQSGPDRNLRA